jgi:AcrR family transcriptional regulator
MRQFLTMSTQTAQRPRRTQRERVEDSARRLFVAAVELIAERGFDRTTTAEISKRAGLSNSMVHMRYGSKEALLEAVLRTYENRMFESVAPPDRTGLEQLVGHVEAVRRELRENPQLLRAFLMIQFETPGAIPQLKRWQIDWLDRYVENLAAAIRTGQADASIRDDLDPAEEAIFFMDAGAGPLFRWVINPDGVDLDAALVGWSQRMRAWFAAPARRRRKASPAQKQWP